MIGEYRVLSSISSTINSLTGLYNILLADVTEPIQQLLTVRVKYAPKFPLPYARGVIKSTKPWYLYLNRARARLAKAYRLLNKGLEDEAGEEAWRATVDAINALALALWNVEIRSHETLSKLVGKLKDMNIVDITVEYGNASSLHHNYYQPYMDAITVKANINQVQRLIEKIDRAIKSTISRVEETIQPALVLILGFIKILKEISTCPSYLTIPAPPKLISQQPVIIKY